jgi:fructose-1,6-bisphosphatase/inositol monophosphatase family enzyme
MRLADQDIREKHPGDFVTVADTEAELLLSKRLCALLPGSVVVAEEACAADHRTLRHLAAEAPVWVLDPIDGTGNYIKGNKRFAMIAALVVKGRTVQGWIHDPISGRTAVAEDGAGSWCDGHRLGISVQGGLGTLCGSVGPRFRGRLAEAVGSLMWQRSAAHDYLALLDHILQFAYFHRLHPWDHAAGVLLHTEAGGYSALLSGTPYAPMPTREALLLAPDRALWSQLRPLLDAF